MSRWNRQRGSSRPKPPPGLRGKEIGLFYKDLYKQKKDPNNDRFVINLKIPYLVLSRINENVEHIQKIARQEQICLAPPMKLEFLPKSSPNPVEEGITMAYKFLGSPKHESNDNRSDKVRNTEMPIEFDNTVVKCEPSVPESLELAKHQLNTSEPVQTTKENMTYFVSNNYGNNAPNTSYNYMTSSAQYKYGYTDIITETFEEKLEQRLSEGINIRVKNSNRDSLSAGLKKEYENMVRSNERYKKMLKFRKTLPTYKKANELLDVINNNQVVVISGETGCGKSTQVPQLILDQALQNNVGGNTKILVTQPRRIAASSLAMRVAEERGEKLGGTVGYCVRLEKVDCRKYASIMFCTTGVLLVELEVNQSLSDYSHIILDEVHERDCQIDLTMCMLKQVLQKRKDLKLILMSATIDAETLSSYYGDCPMIHIEGLAFPVKDIYLEEILDMTKYQLPPPQEPRFVGKPWHKYTKKGRTAANNMEKEIKYKAEISPWLESIKSKISRDVYYTLLDQRIEVLDMNLTLALLEHICQGEPGAILVFLPGIGDITKLLRLMNESRKFPPNLYDIHPLHSKLPTLTQHKIFQRPPGHIRKIIIATNIAETSITIDDIVYVIDCGKIKYSGLDVKQNIQTLKVEWVSKANLRQRRGRAGRCQPGICYHLLTSYRAEVLEDRLLPELQRSNLLEPVLCIKRLRLGSADKALKTTPAVPDEKTVQWAVKHLQQLGALDERETLTPLGWHLARLPVHPAAGKLLILGALFGCFDRAASVAAVWGFKDPFQLVIGKEKEVDEAKRNLAMGEPSDHVAISEAIIQWERMGHMERRRRFAYDHFLSHNNLILLSEMKQQLAENLKSMGWLAGADVKSKWENRNADNMSLFKAIVAASLYPNIATVRWTNQNNRNPRKIMRISVRTPEDGKVSLHPSSVMHASEGSKHGQNRPLCANPGANWLAYWIKQKSTDLFLIDVTCVYTLPLLFFGELNVSQSTSPNDCLISISSVRVCCNKQTTQLLFDLRTLLDTVIASKIMDETAKHSQFDELVLNAVIELITAEDEGAEYLRDEDEDDYTHKREWR